MRKRIVIAAITVTLLAGLAFAAIIRVSNSRTFQFFGDIVARVETPEPLVALTFDDGPTPTFTEEILQTLDSEGVKATFFIVGGEMERNPAETRKIVNAGHEIGNHSYSHSRMIFITPSFARSEVEKTDELIRLAGYTAPIHFRPPYGKKLLVLPYHLSQARKVTVTWDVEPESFPEIAKSTEAITRHVLENTRPGSIILLHVMYDRERKSMTAVRPIILGLKEKGYRFVTVSELMGR